MLLNTIKAAQLTARKERDSMKSTLLTTLIGEAEMVGKSDGNRTSTDVEVLQVIRKFEKNLNENIRIYRERHFLIQADCAEVELEILQEFLPQRLTDLQVQKDIGRLMSALGLPKEQKSMGIVVKELKARYGAQFDGQQVSAMFKQMLI